MIDVIYTPVWPLAGLVVLVAIIMVAILVVRQIAKSRGAAATAVGVFAAACLLLISGALLLRLFEPRRSDSSTDRQVQRTSASPRVSSVNDMDKPPSPEHQIAVPTSSQPEQPQTQSAVWANLDEQPFDANVYPSRVAAAKPLARRIRAVLDANRLLAESTDEKDPGALENESLDDDIAVAEADEDASTVTRLTTPAYFMVYGAAAGKDAHARFAEQLQVEFPISEVRVAKGSLSQPQIENSVESGAVRITLSAIDEHIKTTGNGQQSQQIQGRLLCDIVTANGSAEVGADYLQKPWVEEFDRFVSTRPQQRFVVGYSGRLVSSEEEARHMAMQDAIEKSQVVLAEGIVARADESYVVDRFAQKLSRPYGDVWREAVLLDVSGNRMASAIASAHRQTMQAHQSHMSIVMSLLILFGVTTALCVILNLLTQGYYRNVLLTVGGIVAAIVVLFLI